MHERWIKGKRASWWQLAVICAVAVLVFGNTLQNGFVYDDNTNVVNNDAYRRFDLGRIFLGLSNGLEYLPLRDLSYALDYLLWGGSPLGFHFSNLLYYCASLVAAYFFTRELLQVLASEDELVSFQGNFIPFFTVLLFAVLPYHSEPVSAIFTRNVLLSGLFFFISAYVCARISRYAIIPGFRQIAGMLLLYLCALLAKATAITLPLLFLVILLLGQRGRWQLAVRVVAPAWLVMLAAVFFFRAVAAHSNMISEGAISSWSLPERLAVAIQIPVYYLGKMLVPVGFTIAYDVPFALTPASWKVAGSVATMAVVAIAALVLHKKYPEFLFGLLWYMVTMLPVLNLFHTYPVVADRYFYLPSYGIVLIMVVLLLKKGRYLVFRQTLSAVAIVALSIITFRQNQVYRNDLVLWEHAVSVTPSNLKSLSNMGWTYFHSGSHDKAFETFSRMQQLDLTDRNLDLARGLHHYERQDWNETLGYLLPALRKKEGALDTLNLLAKTYYNLGEYSRAIECFQMMLLSKEQDYVGYRAGAKEGIEKLRYLQQQNATEAKQGG